MKFTVICLFIFTFGIFQDVRASAYETLGCFKDKSSRAIPTIEGHDILLNGYYWTRANAVEKCYQAAKKRGFKVFAVQNGGWCATSSNALQTFNKYGTSNACKSDGEGGPWANQVYYIPDATASSYEKFGCFKDKSSRAIPTIEGQDILLNGYYWTRANALEKCYQAAKKRGFKVFAVQNGGWCATSSNAEKTFNKYGTSNACKPDGEGGPWANQVYYIPDSINIGCYKDTATRAIASIEGTDPILDGGYPSRKNAIAKCAVAARRAGLAVFAVQNGGWCAASNAAEYDKYGPSSACKTDGEGGPWANQVYKSLDVRASAYETLGCFKDKSSRAIPTIEGHDILLNGNYWTRTNAVEKCYQAAKKRGFKVFAVQNGGWCATSSNALQTFNKYGTSNACKPDGEGGHWANQVYQATDYKPIGCYKDTADRAIPTIEGTDPLLNGGYQSRKNAIAKCAAAARKAGFTMFAVQNGGWCAASSSAPTEYAKYGKSLACSTDGKGGPWANQVYDA